MHYTKQFGIAAPELGWVPSPSYILRRAVILSHITNCPPGLVLEIGCGAGGLLHDLSRRGFHGTGVEQSPKAAAVAHELLGGAHAFKISRELPDLPQITGRAYDYLMSFEVLEHIEHDQAALSMWSEYLRPDGTLLLSVPAHRRRWSNSDVWAGHFRRYERDELAHKIETAGFQKVVIQSYGWPLSNFIAPLRSYMHSRKMSHERRNGASSETGKYGRTIRSGIERPVETRLYPLYATFFGKIIFSFFVFLQNRSLNTDLGTGYFVVARKK